MQSLRAAWWQGLFLSRWMKGSEVKGSAQGHTAWNRALGLVTLSSLWPLSTRVGQEAALSPSQQPGSRGRSFGRREKACWAVWDGLGKRQDGGRGAWGRLAPGASCWMQAGLPPASLATASSPLLLPHPGFRAWLSRRTGVVSPRAGTPGPPHLWRWSISQERREHILCPRHLATGTSHATVHPASPPHPCSVSSDSNLSPCCSRRIPMVTPTSPLPRPLNPPSHMWLRPTSCCWPLPLTRTTAHQGVSSMVPVLHCSSPKGLSAPLPRPPWHMDVHNSIVRNSWTVDTARTPIIVAVYSLSCVPLFATPRTGAPPGFSVRGISLGRILEWVGIPFPRGSSRPRDQTLLSCTAGEFFTTEPREKSPITVRMDKKDVLSPHQSVLMAVRNDILIPVTQGRSPGNMTLSERSPPQKTRYYMMSLM